MGISGCFDMPSRRNTGEHTRPELWPTMQFEGAVIQVAHAVHEWEI